MNRLLTAACAVAALAIPSAALAQHNSGGGHGSPHGGPHGGGHGGFSPSFRGGGGGSHFGAFTAGPVSHFSSFQMSAWRGGHWFHGGFGGRFGWWWWADGFWYLYDAPLYPYPGYVAAYYVPAAGGSWYYCDNPAGYYPYVRSCMGPWRAVAPTPPPGAAPPGGPGGPGYGEGAPPPGDAMAAPQGAPPPQDGGPQPQDGGQQPQPQDNSQQGDPSPQG